MQGTAWIYLVLPTWSALRTFESHQRHLVDCSGPPYESNLSKSLDASRGVPASCRESGIVLRAQRQIRRVVVCRPDLNNPPTAVGGIPRPLQTLLLSRSDLNNPHSRAGDYRRFEQSHADHNPLFAFLDLNTSRAVVINGSTPFLTSAIELSSSISTGTPIPS